MSDTQPDPFELLPWYVNDTLTEAERQQVESLLKHSQRARDELQALQLLQQTELEHPMPQTGMELGWRRLQQEIHSQQQAKNHPAGQRWTTLAATAAAILIICIQTFVIFDLKNEPDIQPLSGETTQPGSVVAPNTYLFKIQFRNDASWQSLQQLLQRYQATIIDGPSALGLVVIRGQSVDGTPIDQQALLQALNGLPEVEHAQLLESD